MSTRTITPPANARARYNCTARSPYGDQAVSRDTPGGGYSIIGRAPLGQCRARPPSIDIDTACSSNAAWPVVRADDWCREFDPEDVRAARSSAA